MFISIRYKLFTTFFIAVIVVVVGMFFLTHWSFDRGFLKYVNIVESKRLDSLAVLLQEAYIEQGDWSFLRGNRRLWSRITAAATPEGPQRFDPLDDFRIAREGRNRRPHPPRERENRPRREIPGHIRDQMRHLFEFRVVLMDMDRTLIVGPRKPPPNMKMTTLKSGSTPIGYLGFISQNNILGEQQLKFAQGQKKSFAIISFLIAALATLISFPLASMLVRRINALANGTYRLTEGKYDTRLEEGAEDELGQLTKDFNSLAFTLEKNERLRRQWVADISHELRTPLAVLRGEIEALQDGIRKVSPEAICSLHSEVLRLSRLVGDLYQLSMSDVGALTYRKKNVDVTKILNKAANQFNSKFIEKNITLALDIPVEDKIFLFADPERLHQLFENLLSNSLKYTDADGKLSICCRNVDGNTEILFEDSSPGVSDSDIDRLFERLFRVESSRNRISGGAGLGLAICRNIVEAHGGTIVAQPSPFGGLSIRVNLSSGGKQ